MRVSIFQTKILIPVISLFLFALGFSFVSAEEATQMSATQSVVPKMVVQTLIPGQVSCETPAISSLKTYVYGGSLHSFEFVVSDAFNVVIAGSVGETGIPLNFVSRGAAENGGVKMFVNVQTTHVGETLPISVTMLTAKGAGHSVCISTLLFELHGEPVAKAISTQGQGAKEEAAEKSSSWSAKSIGSVFSSLAGVIDYEPEDAVRDEEGKSEAKDTTVVSSSVSDVKKKSWRESIAGLAEGDDEEGSILKRAGMVAAAKGAAAGVCTTKNGASRTWLIILAIYAIGALLLNSRRGRIQKDPLLLNAALIVPFLALLAFWYFVPECRVGWWTLAGSVVIAVVAVFGKFYLKELSDKKGNPWTAFHP